MKPTSRRLHPHLLCRTLILLALAALAGMPAGAAEPSAGAELVGVWAGALEVGGQRLRLVFHVDETEEGELETTLDSPDQGARGIPVAALHVEGTSVRFDVAAINAEFAGELDAERAAIEGEWRQSGQVFPLKVEREGRESEND